MGWMPVLRRLIENAIRSAVNETVDKAITRLVRDSYVENLFEMVPTARKVGVVTLMEIAMRARRGKPVERPLGSPLLFSPWEQLLFNPVHLDRFPVKEDAPIRKRVTIGPRAKKPLRIEIPVMMAAMSFGGALSKRAKIALAKAATNLGTATNSGEAGLLEEERAAADKFIGQYNRGGWMNTPDKYKRLDAIEIQLGQGAQGSSPQRTAAGSIGEDFRKTYGLKPGEDAVIRSRLPGVESKDDFVRLVKRLRRETGVPVGLKIAATHHLEKELAIALDAEVDFITVDGAEGGTHGGAPTLQDDLGLPTLYAVARAADFLAGRGASGDVSLIAAGGLVTPGRMLKAMALGADAVYIGTAAIMAMIGDQVVESMPFEPPTSLVVYSGKATDKLDVDKAAQNLTRYVQAAVREMELVAISVGKDDLSALDRTDLCALDPFLARAVGVGYAAVAPDAQSDFFRGWPDWMPGVKQTGHETDRLPLQ